MHSLKFPLKPKAWVALNNLNLQISDEEIERILSGKDFEEEEQQRELKQIEMSGAMNSNFTPYVPYLPSGANPTELLSIQASNRTSPSTSNGFVRGPPGNPLAFSGRPILENGNPQSRLLPYQRHPLRYAILFV